VTISVDDFDDIVRMRGNPPPPTPAAVEASRLFFRLLEGKTTIVSSRRLSLGRPTDQGALLASNK
jgi:hypothetical protein